MRIIQSILTRIPITGRRPISIGASGIGDLTNHTEIARLADSRVDGRRRFRSPALTGLIVFVWVVGIGIGLRSQGAYDFVPSPTNVVEWQWPLGTDIKLASDKPTLVMFVHPRCGCSRASLSELAEVVKTCRDRLNVQLAFLMPQSASADWSKSDLCETAKKMAGVNIHLDVDGHEHERFKATTSGEVFLFQPDGTLVMHGGITASRGHIGENRGRSSIEQFVLQGRCPTNSTQVFGCGLNSPQTAPRLTRTVAPKPLTPDAAI